MASLTGAAAAHEPTVVWSTWPDWAVLRDHWRRIFDEAAVLDAALTDSVSVWLEDAPVFRKREIWPPCGHPSDGTGERLQPLQIRLRHNNSWPVSLVVHSPDWGKVEEFGRMVAAL